MPVVVKLSASLRRYVPDYDPLQGLTLENWGDRTVAELAEHLGIPIDSVKIVMINGRHQQPDHLIKDGDRVALFPAVGGG
jgi:molybdopterin converting factor small subunit